MRCNIAVLLISCFAAAGVCEGQGLTDPGFEAYSVAAGGFIKPVTGPWTFDNDAGVVESFSPNSSRGALDTWSARFAAPEGAQYASTYAGSDLILQDVHFARPGDYVISVLAAAPDGDVTIPEVGTLSLVEAAFYFSLDGAQIGDRHMLPPDTDWMSYSAAFTVDSPGTHSLGVQNAKGAPYFINYDNLAIVPEPATAVLCALGGLALLAIAPRSRSSRAGCAA